MRKVAVVGVGQTSFESHKPDSSFEMVYEASRKALADAGLTIDDIDAVVYGTAPDAFSGIHVNGENVVSAAGGFNKPFLRNTTGGATGVMSPIVGYWHVASGKFDTVLVVCEEKMSCPKPHAQAVFIANWDEMYHRPIGPNVIRMASLEMTRYMHESGATKEAIALVAVKNKGNAMDNPHAQLPIKITVEDVMNSAVLTWPVSRFDISPISDGAAAAIITTEDKAKELKDKIVTFEGVGWNQDSFFWETEGCTRMKYLEKSAKQAYEMAGIKDPFNELDVAEVYDPFTYKECHHLEGLGIAKKNEGWKFALDGISWKDGKLPVSPSGGLLGVGNPIAAAGMMKFNEIVLQLLGEAGKRQIPGDPVTGLAHAWGGVFQFSAVTIMRRQS